MLLLFLLAASGCASLGTAPPTIVGKWTWNLPTNHCTEVYEFRADGWLLTDSADERTDVLYTVGPPDANGFMALAQVIVRDHGGVDCTGSDADDTGFKHTSYARLSPQGDELLLCTQLNPDRCFGPLKRRPDVLPYDLASQTGAPVEVEFWYSANPDCSSRGDMKVRVVTPPRHGTLELIDGWGYSSFPEANVRRPCNQRGVVGTHGYYRSTPGFVGQDRISTEVLYPDGMTVSETWNIAVWPSPAKRIAAPEPVYPESFRGRGIEGKVVAWLALDSQGNVTNVSILKSRLDEFSQAFTDAAMQWKYEPPSGEHTPAIYFEQVEYDFKPQ
ncbi:MAG TPA: energy transducer TonB [Usitatibacter sp.]